MNNANFPAGTRIALSSGACATVIRPANVRCPFTNERQWVLALDDRGLMSVATARMMKKL